MPARIAAGVSYHANSVGGVPITYRSLPCGVTETGAHTQMQSVWTRVSLAYRKGPEGRWQQEAVHLVAEGQHTFRTPQPSCTLAAGIQGPVVGGTLQI